ncbi:MAG: methyltransferase domain-containing protein [Burkholderiaceae bacterium]
MAEKTLHRKTAAADRFSSAAERYEQSAHIQKQAAVSFDAWLADLIPEAPQRIAEIGCGTGLLTRLLHARFPQAMIEATDLAPAMVDFCRRTLGAEEHIRYSVGDGRDMRFTPPPDWIVSAMCFQWLEPLLPVMKHHLAQSKVLAFSLVLDGSFSSWRAAHERTGIACGLRACPDYDALLAQCRSLGAAHVHAKRISLTEAHVDGLDFASSLRAIGADLPRDGHLPANLRPVLRQLQDGFEANYEIGFFCIER